MSTDAIALGAAIADDDSIRAVNFFNGRLLTGRDLGREQDARRLADRLVGRATGSGVAWGLEVEPGAQAGEVRVGPGLAVSGSGHTLWLAGGRTLTLVQPPAPAAGAASAGFAPCGVLGGGTYYVAGAGVFLLTLAPALVQEGSAPVLALEKANTRCAFDATVEAVQLRLLRVNAFNPTGTGEAAEARLRNQIAYFGFGQPSLGDAHAKPGQASLAGLVQAMRKEGLSECDVPLAVVYMVGGRVVFVEAWAVRRRLAADLAGGDWADWLGERRSALGEAQFAQFQQHVKDTPKLLGAPAEANLDWLPPAGLLLDGSVDWRRFLGRHAPAREVPLAGGDAPGVLARALADDPVRVGSGTKMRVYRIGSGATGNPGALLFVRDRRHEAHAEQVWFDGQRAALPGAADVQQAIEALRDGQCQHVALRPGVKPDEIMARAKQYAAGNKGSVRLCFEPGLYHFDQPLVLAKLAHVEVHGPGATLINAAGEAALRIVGCDAVHVHDLAVAGESAKVGKDEAGLGIGGALTVVDCADVRIEGVQARCAPAPEQGVGPSAAAIVVGSFAQFTGLVVHVRASISDCDLLVAPGQVGLQAIDVETAAIVGNRVRLVKGKRGLGRGIVVAGSRAGFVRIEGNEVEGAIRGIAVGLSDHARLGEEALQADRVVIERNRVGLELGKELKTERYGVFVGNAQSLRVCGNEVRVGGAGAEALQATCVRLIGVYGPHMVVRDNFLAEGRTGVELVATSHPEKFVWIIQGNVLAAEKGEVLSVQPGSVSGSKGLVATHNEVVKPLAPSPR